MRCVSCNIDISSAFVHAISQNICPACGQSILDEESLALIEDIQRTLLSEASLREETAQKLAMVLVAKYQISPLEFRPSMPIAKAQRSPKIAPPSTAQQIAKAYQDTAGVVKAPEGAEAISDEERERIMAEVLSERAGIHLSEGLTAGDDGEMEDINFPAVPGEGGNIGSMFTEGGENPILEKERLKRLAKQQQALRSGTGAFRRGS